MLPLFLQPALVAHSLSVPFSPCVFPSKCLSSSPFSHNHLTPLRASAETSFTPQPSLWQQVPLALNAGPLSNQHLLAFISLSCLPLYHLSSSLFPSLPPSSFSIVIALICDVQPVVCPVPLPFCLLCPLLYQVTGCPYAVISLSISMPPGDGTVIPSWFEPVHVAPACIHYCIWCQQLVSKWVLLSAFDSSHHFLLARHQSRD